MTSSLIWTPPSPTELLTVFVKAEADSGTISGMHIINDAAIKWLKGEMNDYTYFELLDHYGIDPIGFVDEVEEHMALLMR